MVFAENILHLMFDPKSWYGAIFFALIFLIAASVVARGVRLTSQRIMGREDLVDRTVVMFLSQFAQIAVYVVALIIFFHVIPALNKLGTALLTGVSVMSVVFGLAAQNTLGNLVAGCTLLMYRPFHLDDLIQVATPTGTEIGMVERLTLGYTMLRTLDDRLVIVPNSLMASQVSLNLNRGAVRVMSVIAIGVDTPHAHDAREMLLALAAKSDKVINVIGCLVRPVENDDSIVSLRVWCRDKKAAEDVKREITTHLQENFSAVKDVSLMLPEFLPPPPKAAA